MDCTPEEETNKYHNLINRIICEEVVKRDGSIAHHHGLGKARAHYVYEEYGSSIYMLETLKKAFDPNGIMNMGTLIPWILVVATIILNLVNGDTFNALIMTITNFILDKFDWLFALMSFICVILIVAAYFSPFGNVRIGGRNAKPMMNQTNYIWIVLCTIMAAGILLWACAEPMYHYYNPPGSVTAQSADAISFIMKNSFPEWTFTPMCIYGMPAILFAFLFYNMGKNIPSDPCYSQH